jgi:hypothetical protein
MYLEANLAFYWNKSQNIVLALNFEPKNAFSRTEDSKKDYFEGTVYEGTAEFVSQF